MNANTNRETSMKTGTRIYYTGDMANNEGHGTITEIKTSPTIYARVNYSDEATIMMDDDREFTSFVRRIGTTYQGDCRTRFVTVAAVNAYWSARYPDTYETLPETVAATQAHDLGNNETVSTGIAPNNDGTFTALTRVESKTFKTEHGAFNWLARRGYHTDGTKAVH